METANVVFEHSFDEEMLKQIRSLRTTRLMLAEGMLRELHATAREINERGLLNRDIDPAGLNELRTELEERVAIMRERMQQENTVYADEISLFADLIAETCEES